MVAKKDHVVGSGNVFADLGRPRPAEALARGRLAGFSLDRLVRFLVLLGNDVKIVVKERPRSRQARLLVA
jgi:hypothetical protein